MQDRLAPARRNASYSRRRAVQACLVCRARKTKCDNDRPVCGFCQASGGDCRYPDDDGPKLSRLDRGTLAILQRMGDMEKSLQNLIIQSNNQASPHETSSTSPQITGTPETGGGPRPVVISDSSISQSQPPSGRAIMGAAEMAVECILSWPILQLGSDYAPMRPAVEYMRGQSHSKPTEDSALIDLDPETVHHLVNNFLLNNLPKNPVFDIGVIRDQIHIFSRRGLGWDGNSCLLLLVCAVGTLAPRWTEEMEPGSSRSPHRLARAESFFQASQRRIGMLYHESSLLAIQCSFLTAVYLMSTFRVLAAWKAFSQASTQCIGWLATRGESISNAERHVEESLYWSCLKSDLELRSELRLPGSGLNEMPYPHDYPSLPRLAGDPGPTRPDSLRDSDSPTQDNPPQVDEQLERGWFFYLAEIALRRIMNDVLSTCYSPGSWYFTTAWWTESNTDAVYFQHVSNFEQKLETWYRMLPPQIAFVRDPAEPLGDPLTGILRGHLVDILDIVYFPAVKAIITKPHTELSPQLWRIAAAGVNLCMDRITLCQEGFWHRHQGTWLMIRNCSRSTLMLLAVARKALKADLDGAANGIIATLLPSKWREAITSVIALIEYWKDESPDLDHLLIRMKQLYEEV